VADNDRDEIQRCSLKSLARAGNSCAFSAPNCRATTLMRWPAALPPLADTVRKALERTVATMNGAGTPLVDGAARAAGLAGIDFFATDYERWPTRFVDCLVAALDGLYAFVVKAGTGGAIFRSLYARFLADATRWIADDDSHAAAGIYATLAEHWRQLADTVSGRADRLRTTLELAGERTAVAVRPATAEEVAA